MEPELCFLALELPEPELLPDPLVEAEPLLVLAVPALAPVAPLFP